jgi:hypothetical protein
VTTGTLEEIHSEVLLHPAYSLDLVPSNFELFGPLKEALGGGKEFRADDDFCVTIAGRATTKFF